MSTALQMLERSIEQFLFIVVIGTMRCHIQLAKVSDCVIACPMFDWYVAGGVGTRWRDCANLCIQLVALDEAVAAARRVGVLN